MITTLEVLKDAVITLTPSEDKDYLCELVTKYKFNTVNSEDKMLAIINHYIKESWEVSSKGNRGGVIFLMYLAELDEWTMDAYADMDVAKSVDPKGDFSYRAGKLVMDYFFENHDALTLHTKHDIRNRAATIMCKRLGFKETERMFYKGVGNFITLSITKEIWELRKHYGN